MKKLLVFILSLTLTVALLSSCDLFNGGQNNGDPPEQEAPPNENGGNENGGNQSGGNNQGNNNTPGGNTDGKEDEWDGGEGEVSGDAFTDNDNSTSLCVLSSASARISSASTDDALTVSLTDTASASSVTVRVPVDKSFDTVKVVQRNEVKYVKVYEKDGTALVDFEMLPNAEDAVITPALTKDNKALESEFGMTLKNGTKIDTNYYPGFVRKSVTFTIDDGDIAKDKLFLNIVKPAGIIGTFNICRTTDTSSEEYLSLYEGYEVANHHRLHALPFRETADFHTGKSFESILKDELYHSGADTNYAYKTSIEGHYYINYHYYAESYLGKTSWHAMASDETYFKYADITKNDIEALFGEGSVVGFAYPHGKLTETVKQYLIDAGYLYARKTGTLKNSTGFALPDDRFEWTYNADVSCLLDVMAQYDALSDDGNLKFFAFGVHAADFDGKWNVLEEFAKLYGNRPDDFWYASNRDIFEYEDAIKALEISEEKIVNNSDITVFITVNDEKVIIPANSVYYLDGKVKIEITFDPDNGMSPKTEEANIASLIAMPANTPLKNGFTFDGWYVDGKKWSFNDRATESMTLKAHYKAEPFTNATAEVLPVKGGADGIVAIIHDDGRAATGLILDELYYKYDLVGDVAMPTYTIYNKSTGTTKGDYNKWKSIISTGRWKVASHSDTHSWWGNVTKDANGNNVKWEQDNEKMYAETAGSQEILRNLFPGQRVLSFVYPGFGAESKGLTKQETFDILYSKEARELISDYYVSARYAGENAPAYVDKDSDWMFLDGFFLYASNINGTGENSLKNRLESAANDGRIHLISLHAVSDEIKEGEMDSGSYTLSTVDMEKACKLIAEYVEAGKIWNAHYEDAILYVREAQNATVSVSGDVNALKVTLTDTMDDEIYNYPLTVRITVPGEWTNVKVTQGESVSYVTAKYLNGKWLVDAEIVPDGGVATLAPISEKDIPYAPEKKPAPPASEILPEAPVTPPTSLLDIEVSIGFETDPGATVDEKNSIEFVDHNGGKALRILDTTTAGGGNIVVPFGKTAHPEALSFSFDVNVKEASGGIISTIYFADYTKTPYMLTLYSSGTGYYIGDCQSAVGLGTQTHNLTGADILEFNKWYTIRIDVIFNSVEDFKATVYVDGVKTGESTNRANSASGKPADAPLQNTVSCLKFSTFNSALLDIQIDNLTVKAGDVSALGIDGSTLLLGNDFESGIANISVNRPTICTVEAIERQDKAGDTALKIDKTTTGSSADITIPSSSEMNSIKEFTFEFDINVSSAESGLLAQIFFSSDVNGSPMDFTINATSDGFYFAALSSHTRGSFDSFGDADRILSFNKYYHVKLHVVVGDADTFCATLYIDGENAGTSSVFLNPNGESGYQPKAKVNTVLIGCQSTAKFTTYIDNVSLTVK